MGTPIQKLGETSGNTLFMKREDLIPFSFGGNKARKAEYFFKEIDEGGYDCVVTYGSSSSNHCRIIANMAAAMGLSCHVISPEENRELLYNTKLVEKFGIGDGKTGGFVSLSAADITEIYRIAAHAAL